MFIEPLYSASDQSHIVLVIGENSADKLPDKHKHIINVSLGKKSSLKMKQDGVCMRMGLELELYF